MRAKDIIVLCAAIQARLYALECTYSTVCMPTYDGILRAKHHSVIASVNLFFTHAGTVAMYV